MISAADYTKTAEAAIQLRPNVSVSVNAPNGATALRPGRQTQVVPTVTGARDTSVTWQLTPNIGTIASDGWYTAPATITATQTISARASSVVDPTKSAATTLTLKPPVTVSISPTSAGPLYANATQQFTASVTGAGSPNTAVTWSVYPNGVGSISASGLYTAPPDNASAATINVRATSVEDPLTTASANVNLGSTNISISPSTVNVFPNQSVQFSVSLATGGTVPPLTWGVQPGLGSSITSTGLYTAPSVVFETTSTSAFAQVTANPSNQSGAWIILQPAPPLWVGLVSPVNGYGPTQTFNFRAIDSSGGQNIDTMTATFQTPGAAFPECQILFTPSTGNLQLFYRFYDSYWGQWSVSSYVGQVGGPIYSMNNGNCSVTSAFAAQANNDRTLTLGLNFTPGPVYQVLRGATNVQGLSTGNVLAGTWRTQPDVTISVLPTATTLGANGQQQFGASISGTTNTAVSWAVIAGPGGINASGRYTAPSAPTNASATVRATSAADPAKSATATVTLQANSSISVTMLTPTGTVNAGQTYQLGASVSGTPNTERIWSIVSGGGSVNAATGLYTAPSTVAASFTATVRATSQADPSRFANATLTVNPSPVTIFVNPTSATLTATQSAQFTATVGGTGNTAVTWSVSPSTAGSVTSVGYFTAANVTVLTSATLTATSVADPTKSASASLSIQPQSPVTLVSFSPSSAGGQSSNLSLTGRSTQTPLVLSIAVGEEVTDPYTYNIPCAFHYSTSVGGLVWNGQEGASGSSWISNGACAVTFNSADFNPVTGNWTLKVNVYRYTYGYLPLKARVSSPSGATNWTYVGSWDTNN